MAPRILLARHGQTEWSLSGKHTGRTDVPLLEEGKRGAELLGRRLHRAPFDGLDGVEVRTSPLARARETCEIAGFGERASTWDTLLEWDYGAYEGMTPAEIQAPAGLAHLARRGARGGDPGRGRRAGGRGRRLGPRGGSRRAGLRARAHPALHRGAVARAAAGVRGPHPSQPTSLSVLGWAYGEPAIESWNDCGHLMA